jgi:hypothetical protein
LDPDISPKRIANSPVTRGFERIAVNILCLSFFQSRPR